MRERRRGRRRGRAAQRWRTHPWASVRTGEEACTGAAAFRRPLQFWREAWVFADGWEGWAFVPPTSTPGYLIENLISDDWHWMERNRPKWRRVQGGFPSLGLHVRIRGRGPTGQAGEKSVLGPRPKKRTSQAGKKSVLGPLAKEKKFNLYLNLNQLKDL